MTETPKHPDGKAVPTRRLSRLAGLGGMAAGVAGNMIAGGAKQLASGKRPRAADLLLTPSNARKLTTQLANMRGAAMKIGQMISMDSGDFLPKELSDILARLRSDAQHMPRAQLDTVLKSEWDYGWQMKFATFDYRPMAAASIGQVQRAKLFSGEELAIKVQYPGVKESIDSDVNNVAGLLKMSGLLPPHMDVSPIIEEGRIQLHQEADYVREAAYLTRFGALLAADDDFIVPTHFPEFSTERILAMSYIESVAIEDMAEAEQAVRDHIMERLITLTLRELFEFQIMQTDPNFANYRYETDGERLVLLDFGASRDISDSLADGYKRLLKTVLDADTEQTLVVATDIGLLPKDMTPAARAAVLEIIDMAVESLRRDAPFDFGQNTVALDMREKGMALAADRDLWHVPPAEKVFIQRKFGGIYLLATRLRARVNVHSLIRDFVG
ncbi:ABC1 kinase family protein [Fretibacter rubidus]|uniref:ABC1 kinase family protein n=1 Tax=Fretibacter rubidus TaxID=570162 RepID=UPI00352A68B4